MFDPYRYGNASAADAAEGDADPTRAMLQAAASDPSYAEIFSRLGIDPDNLPDNAPKVPPEHVALMLRNIGSILHQSESFRSMSRDQQEQILANTTQIANALEKGVNLPGAGAPPADEAETYGGRRANTYQDDPFAFSF